MSQVSQELINPNDQESSPFDGLMNAIGSAVSTQQDAMRSVGDLAENVVGEGGEKVATAMAKVADALRDLEIVGPDPDKMQAEFVCALQQIALQQSEAPLEQLRLIKQTYDRMQQMQKRAVDVRVGKALLPLAKKACADITSEDVRDARECGDIMDAFENLFGNDHQTESQSQTVEFDESAAGRLLARKRWNN